MIHVRLKHEADAAGWRDAARKLVLAGVPPESILWSTGCGPQDELPEPDPERELRVPRLYVSLTRHAVLHADPARFGLCYQLLWRVLRQGPQVLKKNTDPLMHQVRSMALAVNRAGHRMLGFVRFRHRPEDDTWLAWYEPPHHVLELAAPHFVRRYGSMRWSILTPLRSAHWDGTRLDFGPGASRADVPAEDTVEELWKAYYAATNDPAKGERACFATVLPRKYRKNMPEGDVAERILRKS